MISLKELLHIIDVPFAFIFLFVGILLSIMTKFPQLRKLKLFFKLLRSSKIESSTKNTISPVQALFTAMSTSLGMGSIVAPPIAIVIGGPGAIFWLMVYGFFGCVTKYTEVALAVKFKKFAKDGSIIGGPTGYLQEIHPFLSNWYGFFTIFLFSAWSALQTKAMASALFHHGVPDWITGLCTAIFTLFLLINGTKSIARFSSKLVPVMCLLYFGACMFILFADITVLKNAFVSIFTHAFCPTAAVGGFLGASAITGLRQGIFKGAYTTEAGVGTSAIPHSFADTDKPTNQGVLAMYSVFNDIFFCLLSGLVTLCSGVWTMGKVSNDLMLHAFKIALPTTGSIILTTTIVLFATGTILGNSFNGSKSFAYFTNNRFLIIYYFLVALTIFCGTICEAPTLWNITDLLLPLIALPNLIGIILLTQKYRKEIIG